MNGHYWKLSIFLFLLLFSPPHFNIGHWEFQFYFTFFFLLVWYWKVIFLLWCIEKLYFSTLEFYFEMKKFFLEFSNLSTRRLIWNLRLQKTHGAWSSILILIFSHSRENSWLMWKVCKGKFTWFSNKLSNNLICIGRRKLCCESLEFENRISLWQQSRNISRDP